MRKLIVLAFSVALFGQSTLDNQRIAQLVRAGVTADEIGAMIRGARDFHFSLSSQALEALTRDGVPADVVKLMAAKQNGKLPPVADATPAINTADGPKSPAAPAAPIRVYVTDSQTWEKNGGWTASEPGGTWGSSTYQAPGSQPLTDVMIRTINQSCPALTVTNRIETADFAMMLGHDRKMIKRVSTLVVFARDGDAVYGAPTIDIGVSVQEACEAIVKNPPKAVRAGRL